MRPHSFVAVLISAVAPFALTPGCRQGESAPSTGAASSASAATLASASSSAGEDEIKPVYPQLKGEPDPAVRRLCTALHVLPGQRKAACCEGSSTSNVGGQCESVVTVALRSGAITLDHAALDRCVEAMEKAHQGCDWVTPLSSTVVPECEGVLRGQFPEDSKCRSSLECAEGLHCHGAGPTNIGYCGKPREGGSCNTGVDVLATYARQDNIDKGHPECAGQCYQHRCIPALAVGDACQSNIPCGVGAHCSGGHCVAKPLAVEGEACAEQLDCAVGLHCAGGSCRGKGGEGEKCERDLDCRATCLKDPGQKRGVCGHRCTFPPVTKPLVAKPPAAKLPATKPPATKR
jgi:hypothetical protein